MLFLKPLAFAASAAAIVIPEVSEEDETLFRTLPVEEIEPVQLPPSMLAQTVTVPCKKCPDPNAKLRLDFAIQDSRRLTVNGFEVFPDLNPWHGELTAAVRMADGQEEEQRLGYGTAVSRHPEDEPTGLHLYDFTLKIVEVGEVFVEGIPPVEVKLVDAEPIGDIQIGLTIFDAQVKWDAVDKDPADNAKPSCDSIWCHAKGKVEDAWKKVKSGMKGCGGMRGHGHKGDHKHKGHGKGGHKHGGHRKGGHPHHGGTMHHDDKHPQSTWGSTLKKLVTYILLPLILGVTAGIGVAVVAMFAGSYACRFFNLMRRPSETTMICPYKAAAIETVVEEDEKSGLMADQDPPPQYDEATPRK